ncbi:hypothetical protein P5V15_009911 [Pogonomyrmex californicus]
MIAPDVMIDGTGAVIISSEEGETESNNNKKLEELGIKDGTILKVDDFHQNYSLTIFVVYREKPDPKDDSPQFLILTDKNVLQPREKKEEETEKSSSSNGQNVIEILDTAKKRKNDTEVEVPTKKLKIEVDNNDDSNDVCIISNDNILHDNSSELKKSILTKRKFSDDNDCVIVSDDHNY